jgi:uncharacterized membrane protein
MKRLLATCLAVCGLLLGLTPLSVVGQVGLTISTPYPSLTVDPGATAEFDLEISTPIAERVDLRVTTTPGEGWTTRLRGGGSTISAVFTGGTALPSPAPRPVATATLEITVPDDVAPNTYQVILQGTAASGGTATLTLDLTVEQAEVGSVSLSTQFPVVRGRAGGTFRFDVQLKNDTNQETTFSVDVQGPADWDLEAQPAGSDQAATAVVAAGASTRVSVTANPPATAEAKAYPITLTALGGPEPAQIELGVEITGSFVISLETAEGAPLNARVTVGSDTPLNLIVHNDGTAEVTEVRMNATPPNGWTVTFTPETIASIPAGGDVPVTATIHPADNAVAGDYSIAIRATITESTDSLEIRTTVETSPIWGFVGIALIVAVVIGLFFVFRQYGRR